MPSRPDLGELREGLAEVRELLDERVLGVRSQLRRRLLEGGHEILARPEDQVVHEPRAEELKGDLAKTREDLKGDIAKTREELKGDIAETREDLKEVKSDVIRWMFALFIAMMLTILVCI